jgi:uncharacterized protein YcbX
MSQATELHARIAALYVYPVKSCAGVALQRADLTETGLDLDRAWMVVDERGEFVTQRELPRMALVRPQLKHQEVILRAPGMLALHLQIDTVEEPARASLWGQQVDAYDMGKVAAQWFTDFLGRPLRLVRFDPEQRRPSKPDWTGGVEALNQFSDGYPLLVASTASLALLNEKLVAKGLAPVTMERFRPNIVLEGCEPHDENRVDELRISAEAGEVRLRLVKPSPRCPIPNVDPVTAEVASFVGDTLQAYRQDPRIGGRVSWGMNAITLAGVEQTLRVGQAVTGDWKFD